MKRFLWAVIALTLTLTACNNSKKSDEQQPSMAVATVEGRFVGSGVESISLERIADDFNSVESIATHELSANGDFSFEIELEDGTSPRYYQITTGEDNYPITLIIAPGDDIVIESVGDIFGNYRLRGSEESQLLCEFTTSYLDAYDTFLELAAEGKNDDAVNIATSAMRAQIEFVIKNSTRLATIYALQLRLFEGHLPQMASSGINHIHLQSVSDALKESYPESPYIDILDREIELTLMLMNAPEALYPNISLTDINRNTHTLSDLKGKVTLLCFWSAQDSMSNIFIAEFREIYNRYHDAGLEAYFVSADNNRAAWIDMVQTQQHPWISVFGGDNPQVFNAYNITVVPYAYIIDKEGNVSYAPLQPKELEELIKRVL